MLCGGKGAEGLILHGSTSRHFNGAQYYYAYANDQMRCGMIVCQFQLADVNEGDGGLCVIPGSHKANFPLPQKICHWQEHREVVYNVPCTDRRHGPSSTRRPCTARSRGRPSTSGAPCSTATRPKYLHFAGGTYQTSQPEWVSELTEAQQAVLEPPYIYNRPLVEADGETVVRPRTG